jgi:hypothetical protein
LKFYQDKYLRQVRYQSRKGTGQRQLHPAPLVNAKYALLIEVNIKQISGGKKKNHCLKKTILLKEGAKFIQ